MVQFTVQAKGGVNRTELNFGNPTLVIITWAHLSSSSLLLAMSLLQGDTLFIVVDEAK